MNFARGGEPPKSENEVPSYFFMELIKLVIVSIALPASNGVAKDMIFVADPSHAALGLADGETEPDGLLDGLSDGLSDGLEEGDGVADGLFDGLEDASAPAKLTHVPLERRSTFVCPTRTTYAVASR
jgi:hypothetical protein